MVLISRMDWDDNEEFYGDSRDYLIYSEEESSNDEDYYRGDHHEDQQSQSEDIDVSPVLCKSHKDKVDLSCGHCKAVSALISKISWPFFSLVLMISQTLFLILLQGLVRPNMNLLQHWFYLKLQWISVKPFTLGDQCLRIIIRKW